MTDTLLPHDPYMDAVAHELAAYGIEPRDSWTETPDGAQLDAVFRDWPAGAVSADHWPHGVFLTWDQNGGWTLVEQGGGRNTWPLSDSSDTYSHPRQIAADTKARLVHGMTGWEPGPICIAGPDWDSKGTHEAVLAWEQ